MTAGKALDGVGEELSGAFNGERFGPHGQGRQREVPRSPAADREAPDGDQFITCVEGSVSLVEKGEVAGDVAGRGDAAERSEELAVSDKMGNGGDDAGQASADLLLRLAGTERFVGRALQQRQGAFADGDDDAGQTLRELIDGADVIGVGVGKEDAADRRAKRLRRSEDVLSSAGDRGVDKGEAVVLTKEVAVHQTESGELVGVGRDLGYIHGARLT